MIEVRGLTKRYGSTVAVDRLSFDVPPGAVTGFLGLNGSGKSTTMRMILGLDAPDAGHARIGGQAYRQLRWPLREAGGLLESRAFHQSCQGVNLLLGTAPPTRPDLYAATRVVRLSAGAQICRIASIACLGTYALACMPLTPAA